MKKRKLVPFDLEKANAGAPLVTKSGYDARIVCTNRESTDGGTIVAMVRIRRSEEPVIYLPDGTNQKDHSLDLEIIEDEVDENKMHERFLRFLGLQKKHHTSTVEIDECVELLKDDNESCPEENDFRFEPGDWIIEKSTGKLFCVEFVLSNGKIMCDDWYGETISAYPRDLRKWTIRDAQMGDVLVGYIPGYPDEYPWIGIFGEMNDDGTFTTLKYLSAGKKGKCHEEGGNRHSSKNVYPAGNVFECLKRMDSAPKASNCLSK